MLLAESENALNETVVQPAPASAGDSLLALNGLTQTTNCWYFALALGVLAQIPNCWDFPLAR